jgi:hypothetical protein
MRIEYAMKSDDIQSDLILSSPAVAICVVHLNLPRSYKSGAIEWPNRMLTKTRLI